MTHPESSSSPAAAACLPCSRLLDNIIRNLSNVHSSIIILALVVVAQSHSPSLCCVLMLLNILLLRLQLQNNGAEHLLVRMIPSTSVVAHIAASIASTSEIIVVLQRKRNISVSRPLNKQLLRVFTLLPYNRV